MTGRRRNGLCANGLHDMTAPLALIGHQCRMCKRIVVNRMTRAYQQTEAGRASNKRARDRYRSTTKGILAEERGYQNRVRGA